MRVVRDQPCEAWVKTANVKCWNSESPLKNAP